MGFLSGMFGGKNETLPTMDKKTVEKALKEALWPLLKQHGFQTFKGRTAWRHTEKRIDVVEIQFFPKEKADQWGITPYSFALPVGCFFTFVPSLKDHRIERGAGLLLPEEVNCHIRKVTLRTIKQRATKIPNIWYIHPMGKNLNVVVEDAKQVLEQDALPWFSLLNDLDAVLDTLLEPDGLHRTLGATGGLPVHMPGFFALELGKWRLARDLLQKAQDVLSHPDSQPPLFGDGVIDDRIRARNAALHNEIHAALVKADTQLDGGL